MVHLSYKVSRKIVCVYCIEREVEMITQGEWKVESMGDRLCIVNEKQYIVTLIGDPNDGEATDNANLIAAAPKTKRDRDALLATCKELVDWLSNHPQLGVTEEQLKLIKKSAVVIKKERLK